MINAFYSAAGAMCSCLTKQDIIVQNIANVNSAGYRRQSVTGQTFASVLDQIANASAATSVRPNSVSPVIPEPAVGLDMRQGVIETTGNPFNFAIEGEGFFVVQTPNGITLTRNGCFNTNIKGELVDPEGRPVLGERGIIRIPEGEWHVEMDGTVKSGEAVIDKIRLVVTKSLRNGIATRSTSQATIGELLPATGQVRQGCLESSNVNIITEMALMMTDLRAYESGQRIVQSLDQTLEKLINTASGK